MLYVYVPCNYTECNQLKILRKNNGTSKRNQGETVLELTLEEAMSSLQTELLMTISLFLNSFFLSDQRASIGVPISIDLPVSAASTEAAGARQTQKITGQSSGSR